MWIFLLQSIFPALLPPHDDVDMEYYQVLGLPKHAPPNDIKRAYKKKSLQLHPDKAKSHSSASTNLVLYEQVQEANNVLKDEAKRKLYHQWKCSVARYRFMERGDIYHPMIVHQNLLTASFYDKTRLLLIAVFFWMTIFLLQPVLLAIKVNGKYLQNTSYWVCFIPLLVLQGMHWALRTVLVWWDGDVLAVLETSAWYISSIIFVYQFQSTQESKLQWGIASVSVFIAILLRMISYGWELRNVRVAQRNMVSEEYLRQVLRPETEEEVNETTEDDDNDSPYIIVQPDEDAVVAAMGMMERPPSREEIEALRVQTSSEYREAEDDADQIRHTISIWILIYLPFAVLTTLQLEKVIDISWWVVFVPVWLLLFVRLCRNIFVCLCLVPPGYLEDEEDENAGLQESADDVPTSRYFKQPESEMSVFAEWDGNNLTSERIAKVRSNDMGMADIEEGSPREEVESPERNADLKVEKTTATEAADATGNHGEQTNNTAETIEDKKEENDTYQQPTEEEEAEYVQAKFHACTLTCSLCLELVVLCLVVGLVQNPTAYNAFWVLFPMLLLTFFVLTGICCCIYARELPMPVNDVSDEENPVNDLVEVVEKNAEGSNDTAEANPEAAEDAGDDDAAAKDATENSAMDELD